MEPNRSLFAAVARDPYAFRLEWSVRRVISGYSFVASAGRNDARKQRDPAPPSQN